MDCTIKIRRRKISKEDQCLKKLKKKYPKKLIGTKDLANELGVKPSWIARLKFDEEFPLKVCTTVGKFKFYSIDRKTATFIVAFKEKRSLRRIK